MTEENLKLEKEASLQAISIMLRIYIEMVTTIAGQRIDDKHDVIEWVHASYYNLFKTIRKELKNIHPLALENREVVNFIEGCLFLLNGTIRPYLTKYHEVYSRWLEEARKKPENIGKASIEFESQFPEYEVMYRELKFMNSETIRFTNEIEPKCFKVEEEEEVEDGDN